MAGGDGRGPDRPRRTWLLPRPRRLALAAAVVWGAVLLAAFVANHPELARLATLIAGASAGPGDGPGALAAATAAAAGTGTAALVSLACWGYGRAASRLLPPPDRFGALFAEGCRFALGTGIGSLALFAAGHAGLLDGRTGTLLALAGLGLLGTSLATERRRFAATLRAAAAAIRRDAAAWPAVAGTAVAAALVLATALAPPTARDAVTYHLAAPKAYIAANSLVELPWNVHTYLPFNAEMLFTWALLIGPDTSASFLHALFGAVTVAVVFALGARATGRAGWGALAALAFASVPSVVWNAAIAHNEMALALFVTIALAALAAWSCGGGRRELVWFGVALGLALATKHTALGLGLLGALTVLVRVARAPRSSRAALAADATAAAGVAALFPLPWYVQNVIRTGNPLYPYFWQLFPTHHPVWDAERAAVLELYLRSTYGAGGGLLGLAALPWEVSVRALDNVPRYFDGVVGPAFLLAAPVAVALFASRRSRVAAEWRAAGALVALGLVVWAGQSQQIRFLVPYLPLASVLSVVALAGLTRFGSARRALVAFVAAIAAANLGVAAAGVAAANPFPVVLGRESRDAYLARRLPYYRFYALLEREMGPDDRVFLVDMGNDTYTLGPRAISDSVLEHYTLARIVERAATPAEVAAAFEALGATHLLVGEDILLDPAYTPFDEAGAARWAAFLAGHTRRVASDRAIALYRIKERR